MSRLSTFVLAALSAFLTALPGELFSQLIIVEGPNMHLTPMQLVQNYLVGAGITISNVTFNGSTDTISSRQIGFFNAFGAAKDSLNMGAGIITTSGKASIAKGPNTAGNAGAAAGKPGDADLTLLSGTATKDASILEFDFIPQCDTVKFNYVFGSDEFDEYCNQYNDAFGFFISGPGVSGPFSNNSANIAHMPNSPAFVTINNICNSNGLSWFNGGGQYFQYDRLTHTFVALQVVSPGETYHIKIAIADAVDDIYDSGVFLEKNSFKSSGISAGHTSSTPGLGSKSIENCNLVFVTFRSTDTITYSKVIRYSISGTAINGVDYVFLPDSVIMPAGTDSVSIVVHALYDTLTEGDETVLINYQESNCKGAFGGIDTVLISDNSLITVSLGPDLELCPGDTAVLTAATAGGQGNYVYTWNISGLTGPVARVCPPPGLYQYYVSAEDYCGTIASDSILLNVGSFPKLLNDPPYQYSCSGDTATVTLIPSMANTIFYWGAMNLSGMVSGFSSDSGTVIRQVLVSTNSITDSVLYTVTPRAGSCTGRDTSFTIFVKPMPVLSVQAGPDTLCNPGVFNASFSTQATGANIDWTVSAGGSISGYHDGNGLLLCDTLTNSGTVSATADYHVTISLEGCVGRDTLLSVLVNPSYKRTVDTAICQGKTYFAGGQARTAGGTFSDTLRPVSGCDTVVTTHLTVDSPPEISKDTSVCPGQSVFAGGALQTTAGTYYDTVRMAGECDTIFITVLRIREDCLSFSLPTAFSPNGDGVNDVFKPVGEGILEFSMQIFDRWGQLVFSSNDPQTGWDGSIKGKEAPAGTYSWIITYSGGGSEGTQKVKGSVTIVR
jgi:gliding motility-associated-like protein